MSFIKYSRLPNDSIICRLTNNQEHTISSKATTLVVILDESGSMGNDGIEAMKKYKKVHLNFMDPKTRVCIIAFQSSSRLVETTLEDLNPSEFNGKGGTIMCPTIPIITQVLQKYKYTDIRMTIVSDGEIGDAHSLQNLFEQYCSNKF